MSTLVYISAQYYIIDCMLVISVYTVELRIVLKKCPSIDYLLNVKLQLCSNRECWQLLATILLIVPHPPPKEQIDFRTPSRSNYFLLSIHYLTKCLFQPFHTHSEPYTPVI